MQKVTIQYNHHNSTDELYGVTIVTMYDWNNHPQ